MSAVPHIRPSHDHSSGEAISNEKIAIALRAFFTAMDAWKVTNDQARVLLGQPKRSTFYHWKRGDVRGVPYDTVRRISYILGIWKALQILFQSPQRADGWLRRPNQLLGGQSAIERMLGGDVTDLAAIRRLLDAARGDGA